MLLGSSQNQKSQDAGFRKGRESAALGIYSSITSRLLSRPGVGWGGGGLWGSIRSGFSPSCTIPGQPSRAGMPRTRRLIGWQGLWAQVWEGECVLSGQKQYVALPHSNLISSVTTGGLRQFSSFERLLSASLQTLKYGNTSNMYRRGQNKKINLHGPVAQPPQGSASGQACFINKPPKSS